VDAALGEKPLGGLDQPDPRLTRHTGKLTHVGQSGKMLPRAIGVRRHVGGTGGPGIPA